MVISLEAGVQETTNPNVIITFQITSPAAHVQLTSKYKCVVLESNENRGITAIKSGRAR